MAKYPKREIALIDDEGNEWARAILTAPAIKRLIKLYQLQEIYLQEREIV